MELLKENDAACLEGIARAMCAVDDTAPRVRGPERRIATSERNKDRAALLVVDLGAQGFVISTKKEYDRATRIERAARAVEEDHCPANLTALIAAVNS